MSAGFPAVFKLSTHYTLYSLEEDFDIRSQTQGVSSPSESDFEKALRPGCFESFNGQEKIIENLRVFTAAAKMRSEALDLNL